MKAKSEQILQNGKYGIKLCHKEDLKKKSASLANSITGCNFANACYVIIKRMYCDVKKNL